MAELQKPPSDVADYIVNDITEGSTITTRDGALITIATGVPNLVFGFFHLPSVLYEKLSLIRNQLRKSAILTVDPTQTPPEVLKVIEGR